MICLKDQRDWQYIKLLIKKLGKETLSNVNIVWNTNCHNFNIATCFPFPFPFPNSFKASNIKLKKENLGMFFLSKSTVYSQI